MLLNASGNYHHFLDIFWVDSIPAIPYLIPNFREKLFCWHRGGWNAEDSFKNFEQNGVIFLVWAPKLYWIDIFWWFSRISKKFLIQEVCKFFKCLFVIKSFSKSKICNLGGFSWPTFNILFVLSWVELLESLSIRFNSAFNTKGKFSTILLIVFFAIATSFFFEVLDLPKNFVRTSKNEAVIKIGFVKIWYFWQ